MAISINEVDAVLRHAQPASESTPLESLRCWRTELVHTAVYVSYAIGVLSLDEQILEQSRTARDSHDLQFLVDQLPQILATGWASGGWSLSPDATASVQAADELTIDYAQGLLGLHAELAASDLTDPDVVDDLERRVRKERADLASRRDELEARVRLIQSILRRHYESGAASVDDWLK